MQGKRIQFMIVSISVIFLLMSGCSGKGSQGIIAPQDTPPGNDTTIGSSTGSSSRASLGAFEVILDCDNLTFEIKPLSRSASAMGDNYQIDVTKFFTDEPCANCFKIEGFGINVSGNLEVQFAIKHPFFDTTKRLDLDIFDTKLIVISDASADFGDMEFPLSDQVDSNGDSVLENVRGNTNFLLNADAYTTHLDMVAELAGYYPPDGSHFDGILNPFKYFFIEDDPLPTVDGAEIPNHRMKQGVDWDAKIFEFKFPTGGGFLKFVTAIEASYGVSSVRYTRMFPVYWLPQFNQKEAYSISVTDTTNSLNTQYDSLTTLQIEVLDWQNFFLQDINYPDTDNILGLEMTSDIGQCTVEVPGITPSLLIQNSPGIGGTGHTGDPMIFQIDLRNQSSTPPAVAGTYTGLVTIIDTLDPFRISIPNDPFYPEYIDDIRAYQVFDVVLNPNTSFDVILTQNGVGTGLSLGVPPDCASFPEGTADLAVYNDGVRSGVFMPDIDNNIVRFNIDYSNAPGGTYWADGSHIVDYNATHPCNLTLPNQPIYRLDAANNGALIICNQDNNFTVDPSLFGLTIDIPNSALVRPYDLFGTASFYFIGGCGSAPGPALGERVWEVFDDANDLDGNNPLVYLTAGPNTEDCGSTVDLYFIEEPYNSGASVFRHSNLNYLLSPGPYAWADLPKIAADVGTGKDINTKIFWILVPDALNPTIKGINIMDPTPTTDYAVINLDPLLIPVDLEVLEFDPANPRALNGITQTTDWICVLFADGVIDIFSEAGALMDRIDGRIGSGTEDDASMGWGEARHMDVDDYDYRIHVTMDSNGSINPGGVIYVSVFSL